MNGDTRIDPVSIFSNVERSAISFLEGVRGGNSNGGEVFKPRFDNDKAVRGTFLANDDMNLSGNKSNYARVDNSISGLKSKDNSISGLKSKDNSISGLKSKSKSRTNNTVIEGFEDGTTTTSSNTTSSNSETINQDLLGNVGQQFYSISQNIMDNDVIKSVIGSIMKVLRLDNIQSSEQLGVLLVVVSALLFFIDLSS
jgi:hypothetical protein